jgi:SAM-dependent methyltransferase
MVSAREQFGRRAAEYATSAVHSGGADRAVERLNLKPDTIALDVGTGAGHTAHALARRSAFVLASDITPEMLTQTRRLAAEQGLHNLQPIFSLAESLPYREAAFDAVTCRLAAHHFTDPAAFCREVARVLKPGGKALLIDVVVPENEETAAYINDIELHRDHSHIEDYSAAGWRAMVEAAGLSVADAQVRTAELETEELIGWTNRSGTAADDVAYIRRRFAEAPAPVVEALSLESDGHTFRWSWPVLSLVAQKPQVRAGE